LFQFTPDGRLENRVALSARDVDESYRVVDFGIDDEILYILDHFNLGHSNQTSDWVFRLRKIELSNATTVWSWQEPSPASTAEDPQLSVHPDRTPYLLSKSGHVIEIDVNSGSTARSFSLNSRNIRQPHFGANGLLYTYDKVCDLEAETCQGRPGKIVTQFLGVDDHENRYACDLDDSPTVLRRTDETYQAYGLGGIVVDAGRDIFMAAWNNDSRNLVIRHWNTSGDEAKRTVLQVPEPARDLGFPYVRLIQVDESGFYVTDDLALYHYSPAGELKSQQSFIDEADDVTEYNRAEALFPLESRVGGGIWTRLLYDRCRLEVDAQGRIYFPITDPEGVKVVRFNPFAEPEKWEE
jgi:hypothetical protein